MKKGNLRLKKRRLRRKYHIRRKIRGTAERPRLVVYRSLNHIYAQLVDDQAGRTLASFSSNSRDFKERLASVKGKINVASAVGKELARKALEKEITKVVFDRNGYLFHGRVKALADGAREGGLTF
ncbi:MAG: 50S ribosomal protein L18 [Chlorobi bacterium]|nr:50S ribosomal protein L18 [Chlorobiota bacterium]